MPCRMTSLYTDNIYRSVPIVSVPLTSVPVHGESTVQDPHTVTGSQLLQESRAAIARLEKEAKELEASCLNLTSPLLQLGN